MGEWQGQVSAGSDDVIALGTTWKPDASYTGAGYTTYYSGQMRSGYRFTNVNIPKGAVITSAILKIAGDDQYATAGVMYSKIKGDDEDNPATFSTLADFNARPRTTAQIDWDVSATWSSHVWYDSPDISSIIQEIIDRDGWQSGNALALFWEDDGSPTGGNNWRCSESYEGGSSYAPKLIVTFETGQTYEISVDAVVQSLSTPAYETTYNITKDASVTSQSLTASETTFNILKDSIAKALADLGIETTFSISKDALVKSLADVTVEKVAGALYEIFQEAIVTAQATFTLESTFNIDKDAITKTLATVNVETIFNVVKEAITQVSGPLQILGVYPINKDALVNVSAAPQLQQILGISKDALVVAVSTPLIQSTFNISPEAIVKVLAEVSVVKEGEVKVTKLFLILGNLAIPIQGD